MVKSITHILTKYQLVVMGDLSEPLEKAVPNDTIIYNIFY